VPMNPLAQDLHIDQFLTNVIIGARNASYIVDSICPIVPVLKQSNVVPRFNRSFFFRDDGQYRAPGTKSQGGGFTVDKTLTYFCDRWSFRFEITDEQRDNTDAPWDLDRDGALFTADKIQLRRERAFAAANFTTGIWGSDKVGGTDFNQWSAYGASNPLVDIANYMDSIEGLIGVEGNTIVLGKQVWLQAKWHPDIIDTIKYTQLGKPTADILVQLTDLTNVYVGRAIYTTSTEDVAEASVTYTRVWGKNALLMYVPPNPGIMQPAACYTFTWQRVPNAISYVKRMRDEEREVDIIEGNTYFAQVVTLAAAGIFLSSAVA